MKARQPCLPLGFGHVHWDTLSPEVRATVLELRIQLLREHLQRTAYVYIPQLTLSQVQENVESRRRLRDPHHFNDRLLLGPSGRRDVRRLDCLERQAVDPTA